MSTAFSFFLFPPYQISVHFLFLLLCRDFFIASSPKNREKERSLKVLEKKNPIFLFLHPFSSEVGAEREKDGLYSSPGTPLICTKAPPPFQIQNSAAKSERGLHVFPPRDETLKHIPNLFFQVRQERRSDKT